MKQIKAREAEKKEPGIFERLRERFRYDIKKMEVVAGRYDVNKKVVLSFDALAKAFIYYAVTQKTQGHKEIMGWLAGKREEDTVEVVDAYVGNCKSSSGHTELDAAETVRMKKLVRERGLTLVGQWHNHVGISTNPSWEDTDTMRTLEKWGMKSPIMLIVNSHNFYLGTIHKGSMKKVDFIMPPKTDNNLDINLGYINGEYKAPMFDYGYGYSNGVGNPDWMGSNKTILAFCGMVGNYLFLGIDTFMPFLRLKKYVDWSG